MCRAPSVLTQVNQLDVVHQKRVRNPIQLDSIAVWLLQDEEYQTTEQKKKEKEEEKAPIFRQTAGGQKCLSKGASQFFFFGKM